MDHITLMDELFGASFSKISETDGKMLCRCGRCLRFMTHITLKPERLYCHTCEETYSLPQNGVIRVCFPIIIFQNTISTLTVKHDHATQEYEEQYCPVDGFQLITFSTGSGMTGRSFSLCPNCYNNPPFPDMEDNCGCNKCTHSSCQYSMVNRGIVPCQDCEDGMVCLDPVSQTKTWRATCNSCSFVLGFPKTVKSLS